MCSEGEPVSAPRDGQRSTDWRDAGLRPQAAESLLEAAPDGVVVVDAGGLIVVVNGQIETLFGYSRDELIGAPVEVLLPERLNEAHTGRRKDGSRFPLEVSPSSLDTADGRLVIAFVRDVTERKRIEEALGAGEERLRAILETANDAFVAMDAGGAITEWNDQAEAMLGWSREEAVGRPMAQTIVPPRYREQYERGLRHFLESGEGPVLKQRVELAALRRDRTEFPVELTIWALHDGEGATFNAFIRDLTDRRQAEVGLAQKALALDMAHERVLASERELRDYVDNLTTFTTKLALDGSFLLVGRTAILASGLPLDELMGTSFLEAAWWTFDPEVHARVKEAFARAVSGEAVSYDEQLYAFGQVLTINFSLVPVRDEHEKVSYVLAEGRDITAQKETEALLAASRLELERSNQDLASFAYVASHDLQEPLRMVSSYVQLLAERYRGKLDADADDFIHFAVDGAQRMQELIQGILEYSRVGTAELALADVDANELVAETVSSLGSTIRETHAEVTLDDLPSVIADRTQLGQVFQNLISNSLRFTVPGVAPVVHVSAAREADGWCLSVEDNGLGVDPDYAVRVFEPFKRLHGHSEYPGEGLGLSVCKRAVERRGGRIWIDPASTGGSVFSFTIPDRSEVLDVSRN